MKIKKQISKWRELLSRFIAVPEYVYLVVALVGVVGFAFTTPPFQGPDEEVHYTRLLYITKGYFLPVDVSKDKNANLPQSVDAVVYGTFFADDLRGDTNNKYETFRTADALDVSYGSEKTYQPIMAPYSPIPYLPAVPAVAVSSLINQSPIVGMYVARLSLGLFSIALIYFAIKLIPSRKYLLSIIALVPMLLFQQAMVSADGVSYSILALFFAFILYLHSKSSVSKKEYVALSVLVVSLALSKTLLYLFIPLIFILWKNKSARKWIIGSVLAAVLSVVLWTAATSGLITNPVGVDSSAQMSILKEHPLRWLRVTWNTYMNSWGDGQVRGVIGVFGYADTVYPLWIAMSYFALIITALVLFLDKSRKRIQLPRFFKWLAIVLCVGYFFAVNLAMYLNYSPVGFDIIYGVQGRYFLPILLAVVFIVIGGGIAVDAKSANKTRLILAVGSMLCVLLAIVAVVQRYYLYTP